MYIQCYISVILTVIVSFPLSEISLSHLLAWLYVFEKMIVFLVRRSRSPLSRLSSYIQYMLGTIAFAFRFTCQC